MAGVKRLSNITFDPVVEGISRKFARRIDTNVDKSVMVGKLEGTKIVAPGNRYMGCVSRIVNVNGLGNVRKNTFFMRFPMKAHTLTNSQMTNQGNFIQVAAWVPLRKTNLQVIASDTRMYKEALKDFGKTIKGISASGYETFTGWLFAIGMAYKKADENLPETAFQWDA